MANQQRESDATIVVTEETPTSSVTEEVIRLGDQEAARPHVQWATSTVDNENMGKKSSKCCCIYKKKKKWDESSSSEDSDCETGHCHGHVEKKHKHKHDHDHGDNGHPGPSGTPA
uniref:Protein phosphatase 1 regulatory subunit 11 n=1 Tax=Panagrolaimus sp. ES5 TaxID=591445 RepID=A0AC34F782_9BILA